MARNGETHAVVGVAVVYCLTQRRSFNIGESLESCSSSEPQRLKMLK